MGKPIENEVVLRNRAKEVRALIIENHEIEKALEIIKEHEEILTFDFGRNKYLSLIPTIRLEEGLKDKYIYLEKVIETGVQIYVKNGNYDELVFFAAASCNVDYFHQSMQAITKENYNKTREGDTILLFFVKYANLENTRYIQMLKILVNTYKLSVNQADYRGHSPIIILLNKYDSFQAKGITCYNNIILTAVSIILNRNGVDLSSHKLNGKNAFDVIKLHSLADILEKLKLENKEVSRVKSEKEDEKNILFALLAQKKENEFLDTIKEMRKVKEDIFDIEDGNNTLLQLACEKNLKSVVVYLIQEAADLSRTTKRNHKMPLEIAARRNFYLIFKELLNAKKIIIDGTLFTIFLLNRGRQIKTKYFDEILCYDGLRVDIAYENGNTPLHYAIIFSNTEAILKLLKRGASLLTKNNSGKAPIDYISKEDMALYLDQCILLDNHNKTHSAKYELRFDFTGLFQTNPRAQKNYSEVDVTSKICSSTRLKSLSTHPLILAFLETKWNVTSPLFNNILAAYGFFFVYYFVLTLFIGHMTFLFLLIASLLIFVTLQPSINLRNKRNYFSVSFYILFTFLIYFLIKNKHISTLILMATLLYHFLRQHLYFSKYQACVVNGIRKVTPHGVILFFICYISNFENNLNNSVIMIPIMIYILAVTYSFNALVDSVGDIENSFKTLYNENTLNFIKFAEKVYCKFNTILSSPFIRDSFKTLVPASKRNKENKLYLNFYLNRNKFVNEKFHFFKLDSATVKNLQDFVNRVSQKSNKN